MSPQADYVVSNGTGAAVRSDINGQLAAIVSNNSGASAPATTYAYMLWADTSTNLLKLRNGANSAWITVGDLTAANLGLATLASPTFTGTATIPTLTVSTAANIPLGSAASPTLYFTGDSNTGLYSPGADQVALSTGGTGRLFINSSGAVGIGTSSVDSDVILKVKHSATSAYGFRVENNSGTNTITLGASDPEVTASGAPLYLTTGSSQPIIFRTNSVERARIDTSGRLGIGSTTLIERLHVNGGVRLDVNDQGLYFNSSTTAITGNGTSSYIAFNTSNAEKARLDSSGRWLLGTSTARSNFFNSSISSNFQIEGTAAAARLASIICSDSAGDQVAGLILGHQKSGAVGGNTILASGDAIGRLSFQGSDGSEFVEAAFVQAEVDGTPGANDMPGRLVFSTTADGASSPTERMRITNNGLLKVTTGTQHARYTNGTDHAIVQDNNNWLLACVNTYNSGPNGILLTYTAQDPNNTSSSFLYCEGISTLRAQIRSNGGLANYQANNVNLSDINTKKDITPAAGTWDCIKEWEIVNYRYKDQPDDADLNLGVIAQQIAESCPEVITVFQEAKEATEDQPAQEERLGIKEQQMYWMAIKALQEAQVRIEALEAEVSALKAH